MLSVRSNVWWVAVLVLGGFILLRTTSFSRNLCYLAVLKDDWDCARSQTLVVGTDASLADVRLAFRLSVHDADWKRANLLAPMVFASVDEEWLRLWVIQSGQSHLDRGDFTTAKIALDFVRNTGSANPQVWYTLGQAYEAGGLADQRSRSADSMLFDGTTLYEDNVWFDHAALAYRAGRDVDLNGAWAEGTYRLAKLYYHQARWNQVIQVLDPILANATDKQIQQPIRSRLGGIPNWQGMYVLLGQSYQEIGDWDDAKRVWQRMVTIQDVNQDWTLNL